MITEYILKNSDKIIAILGLILSVILLSIIIVFIQNLFFSVAAITVLIICIFWLLIRKNVTLKTTSSYQSWKLITLDIIFFFILTISIFIYYFRSNLYERPLIYFIVIAFLSGVLAFKILYCFLNKKQIGITLLQIIIIGINIVYSQILLFPTLVGIDPWYHQTLVSKIINFSHIPIGYDYSNVPFFHLITSQTSLITGLDYKICTMFCISTIIILFAVIFLYLLGMRIFNNQKIALLAPLILIISDNFIHMSYWSIPNSFAILIPLIIYLILKKTIIMNIIALILVIFTIFIHPLITATIIIILISLWLGNSIINFLTKSKEIKVVSITFIIISIIASFSYWTYVSGHIKLIATSIIEIINLDFSFSLRGITQSFFIAPSFEQILNGAGMLLLFSISFIGLFFMISKKSNKFFAIIAFSIFILLGITVLAFVGIVIPLEHRWFYICEIMLCIPASLGLFLLYEPKKKYISLFLVIILAFLMVMNPLGSIDNSFFSPNTKVRYSITESEMQAIQSIYGIENKNILTDEYYEYIISLSGYNNSRTFCNELLRKDFTFLSDKTKDLILIRNSIIDNPFRLNLEIFNLNYNPVLLLSRQKFSKIYDSGSVYGFI